MTREDVKGLIQYSMSLLDPEERRALRRELALEFLGEERHEREREQALPVARTEIVKRHPKDER